MTSGAHAHPEYALADHTHPVEPPVEPPDPPVEPPDPPVEPPDPPPDEGIEVPEGADHDWFLSHPEGTEFSFVRPFEGTIPVISGCTYRGNVIVQSSDDEFTTPSGEIVQGREVFLPESPSTLTLDGNGPIFVRRGSGRFHDVTIEGFEITGVQTAELQHGVIDLEWIDRGVARGNWMHDNGGTSIRTGNDCEVTGNLIHGSEHLAIGGKGQNIDVGHNECFGNTIGHDRFNWESGAMKFVLGTGEIHHNYVHDERAHGIWSDIDAYFHFRSNVVIACSGAGLIVSELTRPGRIIRVEDNIARGNGHTGWSSLWEVMRAQLLIAAGAGIRVHGNEFEMTSSRQYGVSLVQQKRFYRGRYYYVDDVVVVGNKIIRTAGKNRIGAYDDTCNQSPTDGFIPCYLRNRNNDGVPPSRRATVTLGPNELA